MVCAIVCLKRASVFHYWTSNILKKCQNIMQPCPKNHMYDIVRILVLRILTDFVFLIFKIIRDCFRIPSLKLMLRFIKLRFIGNVKVRQTYHLIRSIFHVVLYIVCDKFIYFPQAWIELDIKRNRFCHFPPLCIHIVQSIHWNSNVRWNYRWNGWMLFKRKHFLNQPFTYFFAMLTLVINAGVSW